MSDSRATPSRGYLICCIERTGSNLLADALAGTGVAGLPREYFNPVEQSSPWMREILIGANAVDGLDRIVNAATTPNGVFGAKVHWRHFHFLGMLFNGAWSEEERTRMDRLLRSASPRTLTREAADKILYPAFSSLAGHRAAFRLLSSCVHQLEFVWLKRKNMIARAVSHLRAKQTGIWYLPASEQDPRSEGAIGAPDFEEIHLLNLMGEFQEKMWQRFFETARISPRTLFYEDLVSGYERTVKSVLGFLEIDTSDIAIPVPAAARQSDAVSLEWEMRYKEWCGTRGL